MLFFEEFNNSYFLLRVNPQEKCSGTLLEIEEEIKVLPKFDPDISMRVRTSHQSVPWI